MTPISVGLSASASSGNAVRNGNWSVTGGGGTSKQTVILYVLLAAVAFGAFVIWRKR